MKQKIFFPNKIFFPISLLPSVEKILEKLTYKIVYNFLTENNYIIYDLNNIIIYLWFQANIFYFHAFINLENIL